MRFCCSWLFSFVVFWGYNRKQYLPRTKKRSIHTAKNTLVLSQVSILPASKRKERMEEISFQALAFRILFDDFQSMHQKYLQPLSCKKGSWPCFSVAQNPFWKCTSVALLCISLCLLPLSDPCSRDSMWWSSTDWVCVCSCWEPGRHMHT